MHRQHNAVIKRLKCCIVTAAYAAAALVLLALARMMTILQMDKQAYHVVTSFLA